MNGKVTFLRRVNLGNYEHKEASAEISFSVEDDADYLVQKGIVDKSMDQAVEVVESRLGLRTSDEPAKAAMAKAEAIVAKAKKEPKPAAITITGQTGIDVQDMGYLHPAMAAQAVNGLGEKFVNGEVDADGDPLAVDPGCVPLVSTKDDTLADLDAELADIPREVNNDELHSVCRAYVIKHGQPGKVALQRLLAGYATQIAAIPQPRRLGFLGAMETLTP